MLTDYHLHLQPDGVPEREAERDAWEACGGHLSAEWIGRYAQQAGSRAVDEIAITEHVHRFSEARDWLDNPWWQAEATEDVDAYCDAVRAVGRDLPVILGIEMDWLPGRERDIAGFLEGRPFDIVLGSVHWLDGSAAVDHPEYLAFDTRPAEQVWSGYLDALISAASSGLFDVLAHIDLPKKFGHHFPPHLTGRLEDATRVIARSGLAVECSSAGLRKQVGEVYPDPDLLAALCRAGVPATLSSDAHAPDGVAADFPTAVAVLKGAGYATITRYRGRVPEQVEI